MAKLLKLGQGSRRDTRDTRDIIKTTVSLGNNNNKSKYIYPQSFTYLRASCG